MNDTPAHAPSEFSTSEERWLMSPRASNASLGLSSLALQPGDMGCAPRLSEKSGSSAAEHPFTWSTRAV